jgi:hypothetical protein
MIRPASANAAQNIGIVCQEEGEAARASGDEPTARRHFEAARRSVEKSLRSKQARNDKPAEALARYQLVQVHLRLGGLDVAERQAHEARKIHESLGLKEAWGDYDTLSEIAKERGDAPAAAEWAKKRDDLLEELERRAGGGGGLSAQMLQAVKQLAIACAQAGFANAELGPGEEEALATLDQYPEPFPEFVAYLRQLATGQVSPRSPPPCPPNCGNSSNPWPKPFKKPAQVDHVRWVCAPQTVKILESCAHFLIAFSSVVMYLWSFTPSRRFSQSNVLTISILVGCGAASAK